jgi:YD repeat-containing protein
VPRARFPPDAQDPRDTRRTLASSVQIHGNPTLPRPSGLENHWALGTEQLRERVLRALELGFTQAQAVELAQARDSAGNLVSMHNLGEMIGDGCPHDLAYQICV